MKRIALVRHGRASGGWDDDPDPGLDDLGREQAAALADRLGPDGDGDPPLLVSSPLRRCRETASPLATRWGVTPQIESRVSEIPSPDGIEFGARVPWLRAAMGGTWADLGARYTDYRDQVVDTVRRLPDRTVVVSHFVAINTVIGAALGDDRVLLHRLDNTSVTVIGVGDDGSLHLIESGLEADTLIR